MNDFIVLVVTILLVLTVFLLLFLGHLLILRPKFFFEHVFPSKKPEASLFWSKESGATDRLLLYYGARLFLLCLVGLSLLALLHAEHLI